MKNVKTGEVTKVEADPEDGMFGLFGFIGTVPNTKIFEGIIDMDERGYIKTDADMHTNIPGVYAAGDVRVKSLRQVVTAAADGAIAAVQVETQHVRLFLGETPEFNRVIIIKRRRNDMIDVDKTS
mgnify:CR=1 FL=1